MTAARPSSDNETETAPSSLGLNQRPKTSARLASPHQIYAATKRSADITLKIARRLWPLYRRRLIHFAPSQVESHESNSQDTATSQVWSLSARNTQRFPAGTALLSTSLSASLLPVTGRLQYKLSHGFDDNLESWIFLDQLEVLNRAIHIPEGVEELRLIAYTDDPGFRVRSLSIREIGSLQKGGAKLRKLLASIARNPAALIHKAKKAYQLYRKGGVRALKERLIRIDRYSEWIAIQDAITPDKRKEMKREASSFAYKPLVSIVLPIYNVPERFLRLVLESVRSQIYPNWELCVADDNSPSPHVKRVIREYASLDSRIKYIFREQNGHIAEATNTAAQLATGEFIGFLDHDDELRENALFMMVRELNAHPNADLLYSDEDKITEDGIRHYPHFKSDWNPELILCQNYVCHFTMVRRAIFEQVGGIHKGFDGAQDWDFVLRVSEKTSPDKIRHVPHVLYHWRVIDGSTAKGTESKPYVTAAQIKAVSEHLERKGDLGASVEAIPAISMLRIKYRIPEPPPLVSIIIPTYNESKLLSTCVDGILRLTSYKNIEILIVDNRSDDAETLRYLATIARDARVTVIRDDGEFNFARLNNDAVKRARGSLLCFLNNDIQVTHATWLDEMVSNVTRHNIGAVGARLLYPNGTVQHAGVILGIGGVADHMMKHLPAPSVGYFCRAILPQNLSAVTAACMLVTREAFERVGGFDQETFAVAYNDVDLCLRLRQAGSLIIYTPYAELIHHESVSRGYEDSPEKMRRFQREFDAMKARWGALLERDPYYNPNCSSARADFSVAL